MNPQSRLELTGESFFDEVDSRFSTANLPGMAFESATQNLFEERRTSRQRISLGYSFENAQDPGTLQSAKAQIYYQDVKVDEENDRNVLARGGRITRDQAEKEFIERSIGGSLKFRSDFKLGGLTNKLSYGLEASNNDNERNDDRFDIVRGNRIPQVGYPRKDYPDSNTLRLSLFAQNEISWNQGKLKVIPGLRFDSYNLSVNPTPEYLQKQEQPAEFVDTALSPSLGLLYQPNDNLTFFGRYSRGFRPPLYSELNTSFRADIPVRPHKGIPNPNLTAETANNFHLSKIC